MFNISFNTLRRILLESNDKIIKDIISVISKLNNIEFSKQVDYRDRIVLNINSDNPMAARSELASNAELKNLGIKLVALRKNKQNGFSLVVANDDIDKPIFLRIRKGGKYMRGIQNEVNILNILQNSIDSGFDNIEFVDNYGNTFEIEGVESFRQCGSDEGSRLGNRGDVEIKAVDDLFRLSIKKDNAYKIAGLVRKFAPQSAKIGKIVRAYFKENNMPFENKLISVKITNPELFKWCWFGNDLIRNGAVIKTNFKDTDAFQVEEDEDDETTIIGVEQIILPTDNVDDLIDDEKTAAYFTMKMLKSGSVAVWVAARSSFAKRYEVSGLLIPGVNS